MAVLEKIRKRSVLLFIIIIGALLAFILGDFLNSGRSLFGPGDTVEQVGNVKVSQMDLNKTSDQIENYVKNMRASNQNVDPALADPDYRYAQALDAALSQKLLEQEYDRLGIDVTDEFISKLVSNPASAGQVAQILSMSLGGSQEMQMLLQQAGITDPISYLDAIKNPARYRLTDQQAAALTSVWQEMESTLVEQVQQGLYTQTIMSMLQPNKADAKAYFENQNNLANVQVASVPLSSVADNEVTIEDADYEAEYNKTKDAYRLKDESREVAFILVDIVASPEDYAKADAAVRGLVADLNTMEFNEAMKNHKGFAHQTRTVTDADLTNNVQLAALRLDSAGIHKGLVKELFAPRGTKVVAKVNDVTSGIDNVVYSFFPVESVEQADSIFADKSVAAVDSIITAMTGGQLADMKTSLINPDVNNYAGVFASRPVIAEAIKAAPLNQYYLVSDTTAENAVAGVLVVKERGEVVPAYDLSILSYEIYPSEQTRQNLTQELHNYVANHPTAEKFANDTTGTYNVLYNIVSPQSYSLSDPQQTPGTRPLVKWVMDAKKGAVSPVFSRQRTIYGRNGQPDESQDYLVAVAVMDVYDDYVPVKSQVIQDGLKQKVTANKKASVLIDKYQGKGKNVGEYASAMGVTPQNMNVAFGARTIGGQAQGAVAAAKKGDVVGPVQGANAVYVFQVEEVTAPEFEAADTKTRIEEANRGFRRPNLSSEMLVGNRKVKNNTLHFTASPTAE